MQSQREITIQGGAAFDARLWGSLEDLRDGLGKWRLWSMLAWIDIRQRYRRAVIGPFWLTLSMAVMVTGMSIVYGTLFARPLNDFLPFIAGGFLAWAFISTSISDGTTVFVQAEGLIKYGGLPLSLHIWRVIWRNILIMAHNAVVVIAVCFYFGKLDWSSLPLFLFGLLLVSVNLSWVTLCVGPLCTRFRDLAPIVQSLLQLMFFITPIVFPANALQSIDWIVTLNPFHYLIDAIRSPLLGQGIDGTIVSVLVVSAIVGWAIAVVFFARVRNVIAFWV